MSLPFRIESLPLRLFPCYL